MTPQEALGLTESLFAHYPAVRPSKLVLEAYSNALGGMSREVAKAAITRVTRTSKFCPSVAELMAACVANAHGDRRSGEEAYTEVMLAVRRFGRCYGDNPSPEFSDPIIARCLGVWGSWNDVCNAPDNDPSGRMRFVELYNKLAAQGDQSAVLPQGMRTERRFGFAAAVRRLPEPKLNKPPTAAELAAFGAEEP